MSQTQAHLKKKKNKGGGGVGNNNTENAFKIYPGNL